MDKKQKIWKGAEMLKNYGASEAQVNKALAQQVTRAVTEQHGENVPPGSYDVELPAHLISDVFEPTYVVPTRQEIDAKARQVAAEHRQLYAEVDPVVLQKTREGLRKASAQLFSEDAEHWEPRNPEIIVIPGAVCERLRFCARKANGYVGLFMVRMSELDKGTEAEVVDCRVHADRRKLAALLDCGWLLPQLLAAREQYQADLWAIIKGDKQ